MIVKRKPSVEGLLERLSKRRISSPPASLAVGIAGSKDFGLVTKLPTAEAAVGDVCRYWADKTKGIVWDLIYTGEGEFPWSKIGGPDLLAEITAEESITNTGFETKGSPALTAPLKGDYYTQVSCRYWNATAAAYGYMSPKIGAAAAVDDNGLKDLGASAIGAGGIRRKRITGIAAATVIQSQIRVAGGTGFFNSRWITIDPIRVG